MRKLWVFQSCQFLRMTLFYLLGLFLLAKIALLDSRIGGSWAGAVASLAPDRVPAVRFRTLAWRAIVGGIEGCAMARVA